MIEALKSDELVTKAGGRFRLCALLQRRVVQLMDGERPLVERRGRSDLEVAIDEILQDMITAESIEATPGASNFGASNEPLL